MLSARESTFSKGFIIDDIDQIDALALDDWNAIFQSTVEHIEDLFSRNLYEYSYNASFVFGNRILYFNVGSTNAMFIGIENSFNILNAEKYAHRVYTSKGKRIPEKNLAVVTRAFGNNDFYQSQTTIKANSLSGDNAIRYYVLSFTDRFRLALQEEVDLLLEQDRQDKEEWDAEWKHELKKRKKLTKGRQAEYISTEDKSYVSTNPQTVEQLLCVAVHHDAARNFTPDEMREDLIKRAKKYRPHGDFSVAVIPGITVIPGNNPRKSIVKPLTQDMIANLQTQPNLLFVGDSGGHAEIGEFFENEFMPILKEEMRKRINTQEKQDDALRELSDDSDTEEVGNFMKISDIVSFEAERRETIKKFETDIHRLEKEIDSCFYSGGAQIQIDAYQQLIRAIRCCKKKSMKTILEEQHDNDIQIIANETQMNMLWRDNEFAKDINGTKIYLRKNGRITIGDALTWHRHKHSLFSSGSCDTYLAVCRQYQVNIHERHELTSRRSRHARKNISSP